MGSLTGITVIALEQAVAAPLCTARLADAGARVIKIERAEGDFARFYDKAANGQASYFVWLNRGKESLVLDIKQPEDAALLHRMIAGADVFVENLAPGAAMRAGFDPDELCRRHPRLIACSVTGYGKEGPESKRKAYDLLIQAESGLASVTGSPEAPGRVGVSVVDIATGLNAHAGVLERLYARERTGLGGAFSVSLFDSTAELMAVPFIQHQGGKPPQRVGLAHPSIAPYGVFTAGDGGEVLISIQNEREWQNLCRIALRRPDLAEEPRYGTNALRVSNRPALEEALNVAFRKLTRAEMLQRLRDADIAFGALNNLAQLEQHPHLRRLRVATENGPVDVPAPPVQPSGPADDVRLPRIGEHSDALRREFTAK